jgi:hypothetical protein
VLRTEGNFSIAFRNTDEYYGPLTGTGQSVINQGLPVAETEEVRSESYTWTNTANYSFTANDMHNWSFLLGQEIISSQSKAQNQTNHLFARSVGAEQAWKIWD